MEHEESTTNLQLLDSIEYSHIPARLKLQASQF